MNVYTTISLGIAVAGFVIKIADLSAKYGRLCKAVENNEKRDSEERERQQRETEKNSLKFTELYNRMGKVESTINGIQSNVTNITTTVSRIESKLDRIIERGAR